jgi:hypothetical protein
MNTVKEFQESAFQHWWRLTSLGIVGLSVHEDFIMNSWR